MPAAELVRWRVATEPVQGAVPPKPYFPASQQDSRDMAVFAAGSSHDTTSANHPRVRQPSGDPGEWGVVTAAARGPSGSCVPLTGPSDFDNRGDPDPKAT